MLTGSRYLATEGTVGRQKCAAGLILVTLRRPARASRDRLGVDVDAALANLDGETVETAPGGAPDHVARHLVRREVTGVAEPSRAVSKDEVRKVCHGTAAIGIALLEERQQLAVVETNDVKARASAIAGGGGEGRNRPRWELLDAAGVDHPILVSAPRPREVRDHRHSGGGEQHQQRYEGEPLGPAGRALTRPGRVRGGSGRPVFGGGATLTITPMIRPRHGRRGAARHRAPGPCDPHQRAALRETARTWRGSNRGAAALAPRAASSLSALADGTVECRPLVIREVDGDDRIRVEDLRVGVVEEGVGVDWLPPRVGLRQLLGLDGGPFVTVVERSRPRTCTCCAASRSM